jgi:hypothetical protein
MDVPLTPELEKLVRGKVELQKLRRRIDMGLGEALRGETADGESFTQGLLEDLDAKESKRKTG